MRVRALKSIVCAGAFAAVVTAAASSASAKTFVCSPTIIGVFVDRIAVQCTANTTDTHTAANGSTVTDTVKFFAAQTARDQQWAARVLATVTTALSTGRTVIIDYFAGQGTGGCLVTDCRDIDFVRLQ